MTFLTHSRGLTKLTVAVLLAAAMLALFGLASRWPDRDSGGSTALTAESDDIHISFWKARAEQSDLDYLSRTYLGAAYIAYGRRSGDFGAYDAAAVTLGEALELNPRYSPTLTTMAAVHLGRHEFLAALTTAEQAYEEDPSSVGALAAIGDAHLELGHYEQAFAAYQSLHRRLPGAEAEARLARLAFLFGRTEEAIERARLALELAGTSPDPSYSAALATYALDSGDIELAAAVAETALEVAPTSPAALETLAQVRAAEGKLDEAAALYERLHGLGPDPGAHAALGDIYTQLNRPDEALEQYLAVEPAARSITENPVVFDREIAVFLADHQRDIPRAVGIAQRDLENRQDIFAYDTLAWALYWANDFDGAAEAIEQALVLGTQDPHLLYHAGMIAAATGHVADAERLLGAALAINPRFDVLQAPLAAKTLLQLGEGP